MKTFWIFAWTNCPVRPTVGYKDDSYKHLVWNLWVKR